MMDIMQPISSLKILNLKILVRGYRVNDMVKCNLHVNSVWICVSLCYN
jgi:hypothetical protein